MNEPNPGFQEIEAEFTAVKAESIPQSEFGKDNDTNGADPLEKLQQAVVNSSSDVRRAFFMFGAFSLYLIITVGATTHEQLLRGSVFTLPILGVDIPIVGFYVIVPLLFVLAHLNLLGEFNSLADDADELKTYLAATNRRLDSPVPFGFCRLFIQPDATRVPRGLICMIAAASAVIFPPLILLAVQVRFLPYHSELVTTLHRLFLLSDVVALWWLWPRMPYEWSDLWPAKHRGYRFATIPIALIKLPWPRLLAAPATGLMIIFSWLVATVPEGWAENAVLSAMPALTEQWSAKAAVKDEGSTEESTNKQVDEASCGSWRRPWTYFQAITTGTDRLTYLALPQKPSKPAKPRTMPCLSYRLFEAPETWRNLRRNLIVSKANLVDVRPPADLLVGKSGQDIKNVWEEWGRGLDLRARDLRFADFTQSDLRLADLRGADLSGAKLFKTHLQYSDLGDISMNEMGTCVGENNIKDDKGNYYCFTALRASILINTEFQFARLWRADLRGSYIEWLKLKGADLSNIQWNDFVIEGYP